MRRLVKVIREGLGMSTRLLKTGGDIGRVVVDELSLVIIIDIEVL